MACRSATERESKEEMPSVLRSATAAMLGVRVLARRSSPTCAPSFERRLEAGRLGRARTRTPAWRRFRLPKPQEAYRKDQPDTSRGRADDAYFPASGCGL